MEGIRLVRVAEELGRDSDCAVWGRCETSAARASVGCDGVVGALALRLDCSNESLRSERGELGDLEIAAPDGR